MFGKSKWQMFANVCSVLGVVLVGVIWLGQRSIMGTRLEIIGEQAVNYSGTATEQDARSLGNALKEIGYFDGKRPVDVLLSKGEGGTAISFIVNQGVWNDAETVENFRTITAALAPSVGGLPVTLRLMDEHLNTEKEVRVE